MRKIDVRVKLSRALCFLSPKRLKTCQSRGEGEQGTEPSGRGQNAIAISVECGETQVGLRVLALFNVIERVHLTPCLLFFLLLLLSHHYFSEFQKTIFTTKLQICGSIVRTAIKFPPQNRLLLTHLTVPLYYPTRWATSHSMDHAPVVAMSTKLRSLMM
jgi:hypothetical protein